MPSSRQCPARRFSGSCARDSRKPSQNRSGCASSNTLPAAQPSASPPLSLIRPASELADLYGSRWGIEEMVKISKSIMAIAPFHARTERGVRQELFAHFNLMAMTRIFTNHGDANLNARKPSPSATERTTNFKYSFAAVARNLEALLLKHAATVSEAIQQVLVCVATGRQKTRPGRSYQRRSRKPLNRWHGKHRKASTA